MHQIDFCIANIIRWSVEMYESHLRKAQWTNAVCGPCIAFIWHSKLYYLERSNLVAAVASVPSASRLTIFQPKRVCNKIKLGNTTASMHQFILPFPVLFFHFGHLFRAACNFSAIRESQDAHTQTKKSRKVVSRQNFRVRDNIHSVPPFSLLLLLFQHLPHSDRL